MPQIIELKDNYEDVMKLKEEGNKFFKCAQYLDAIQQYSQALNVLNVLEKSDNKSRDDRVIVYKNLSAAYLKLNDFENAISNATNALQLSGNDVKALYRRCQAYEAIGKYNEAFKDALAIQRLEPKNSANSLHLSELNVKLQQIAKENSSTNNRLTQMIKFLCDETLEFDKRLQSANNILVLTRDKTAANLFIELNGIQVLLNVLHSKSNSQLKLACIRAVSEMIKNDVKTSLAILAKMTIQLFINLMSETDSGEYVNAIQITIQSLIESLSGFNAKEDKKPNKELLKLHENDINLIMTSLIKSCSFRAMSALARDAILELIARNIGYNALDWGMKVIKEEILIELLEVSAQLEQIDYESNMRITSNTRMHVSLALDRIYLCMEDDKSRQQFNEQVMQFINNKLKGADIEDKVRATASITALLNGPIDAGNNCLSQQGVIEMMLVMAGSDDEIQQRVAAEAIIAAASKKDKCTSLVSLGSGILKNLFKSSNDHIRVRALVGLCKLGSVGGTDASVRPFGEGSTFKLADACRKFLVGPSQEKDIKKWAAEGLAYLTLDADVKEHLMSDKLAINAMVELARNGDLSVLFGVVTTFVNLTNSYEKQEMIPELVELAKFAKQHVPEEHPKDAKEYIDERCKALAHMQVITALVALCKTESKTSRDMISRVFNAICEHQELRGIVVQQGGTKVLIKLAIENNTDNGKNIAAQALARIGITINPEVAFPGQRCLEVVRPLLALLHPDCHALQNFEALMALTNLAQVSPSVRARILKDFGFSKIENYLYDEHPMLKRASSQCILNLMMSDETIHIFEGEGDRVKYLVLLTEDEDSDTAKSAAGALAMVTSVSKICCEKVFDAKSWHECLIQLISNKDHDLQYRGVCIIYNLIDSSSSVAQRIVETNILEVLMAITRPEVDDIDEKIKDIARKSLKRAEELKLIKSIEEYTLENHDENDD